MLHIALKITEQETWWGGGGVCCSYDLPPPPPPLFKTLRGPCSKGQMTGVLTPDIRLSSLDRICRRNEIASSIIELTFSAYRLYMELEMRSNLYSFKFVT